MIDISLRGIPIQSSKSPGWLNVQLMSMVSALRKYWSKLVAIAGKRLLILKKGKSVDII